MSTKNRSGKGELVIYESDDGLTHLNVQLEDETVWLTQAQMARLFGTKAQAITKHIGNIYEEGELREESTCSKMEQVQTEGSRKVKRNVSVYNLDMVISVGYRVNSKEATHFRQWATDVLKEYMTKGFALDDNRLKDGRSRYFRELYQRVRDIRSSERNLYQQVTDIYSTAIDYDKDSKTTRAFFATVQNKMHYAAHEHTAAEVVYERVDGDKPNVGMTNFTGDYATKEDVGIAKNYLTDKELQVLNLLVERFLDYAELQALEENPMTMQNWTDELDRELLHNNRALLQGKGTVSHKQALDKAHKEFEEYRTREMQELESDFDRAIKQLKNAGKADGSDE